MWLSPNEVCIGVAVSVKNICAGFITVSVKKLLHYRAGGLLQYRAVLLHYRAVITLSGVFLLHYRARITVSGVYYIIGWYRSCQTARPIGTKFGTCLRIRLGMDITIRPSIPQGAFRAVLGGHKFKSGKAAKWMDRLHQIRYTSVDSSGNGHRLKTIRPTISHGGILGGGGGLRGSTIQKPGKCGQTAGPIGNKLCTYNAGESGNGHRLNKSAPWDTRGAFWRGLSRGNVLRGSTFH